MAQLTLVPSGRWAAGQAGRGQRPSGGRAGRLRPVGDAASCPGSHRAAAELAAPQAPRSRAQTCGNPTADLLLKALHDVQHSLSPDHQPRCALTSLSSASLTVRRAIQRRDTTSNFSQLMARFCAALPQAGRCSLDAEHIAARRPQATDGSAAGTNHLQQRQKACVTS